MSERKPLIIGLGQTGLSIARYYARRSIDFVMLDSRLQPPLVDQFKSEFADTELHLGALASSKIAAATESVVSPGIDLRDSAFAAAKAVKTPLIGDVELFAREISAPVIAITGSNGKSTVTTLVGEMLQHAGYRAIVAGNIGVPVLDVVEQDADVFVLELSSFQLERTHSLRPFTACVLNVAPDHMDRYDSFVDYVAAKKRIFHAAEHCVVNREQVLTERAASASFGWSAPGPGQFGLRDIAGECYLASADENLLPISALKIVGRHNVLNALAAAALASTFAVSSRTIIETLTTFSGLPHRCQFVRRWRQVDWYNDSKGTNVAATAATLTGLGGDNLIWLAGGQGKGAEFNELCNVVGEHVRHAILFGEDADRLQHALAASTDCHLVTGMQQAVLLASELAEPNDVVVLSPACASFDMFSDFAARGAAYMTMVNSL